MSKTGNWLKDFLDITMIALPKKNQVKKCKGHRITSLILHIDKIVTHMLSKWLESKIEEVKEDQFGFWKDKDTREATQLMRIISRRGFDFEKFVFHR
jgi:hypothetical protein